MKVQPLAAVRSRSTSGTQWPTLRAARSQAAAGLIVGLPPTRCVPASDDDEDDVPRAGSRPTNRNGHEPAVEQRLRAGPLSEGDRAAGTAERCDLALCEAAERIEAEQPSMRGQPTPRGDAGRPAHAAERAAVPDERARRPEAVPGGRGSESSHDGQLRRRG